ncbi:radical SAM protein [Tichowtungia aerotolerans]|uniref:Radical SAM protein n=1 Tax=Tichowtungia aerotolerans TaxID=2697043 RepID=A0A6P1M8W1_9BACT|nr:radical SAM protein [Tichowtungia aerotolerans]QHI68974.1 radical SAM protein [Tichowtungia aerotolerans]
MKTNYKYLFGPVPSRRLGRSLGIDVTPFKTCSLDCIFCQCGCTTYHITERSEFVPFEDVCTELEQWLAQDGCADYITFAGSGEPTLYSRLGELIAFIKEKTEIPVIVLSNGTLFHRSDVCKETALADIVKVSLSAWNEPSFQKINRPASGLSFADLLAGERNFRNCFNGQLWLEVFLMEGINSKPEQVQQIAELAREIEPDTIHLNTAVRPPAETGVMPVSEKVLCSFCPLFTPPAEIIASFGTVSSANEKEVHAETLAALIHRHPATATQLAAISGSDEEGIRAALAPLVEQNQLQIEVRNGEDWYK